MGIMCEFLGRCGRISALDLGLPIDQADRVRLALASEATT